MGGSEKKHLLVHSKKDDYRKDNMGSEENLVVASSKTIY